MTLNQDAFSNSTYLSQYNSKKRLLEEEIGKIEKKIEEKNSKAANKICLDCLRPGCKEIDQKLLDNYYTTDNLNLLFQDIEMY